MASVTLSSALTWTICGTHFVLGITYTGLKKKHTELLSSVKRFTNKIVILKTRWAGNHCLLQNCTLIHTISLTHWPAFLRHSIQYLTIFIIRENGMPRLKRSFHYPSRLFILWNSSKKIGCINNLIQCLTKSFLIPDQKCVKNLKELI